MDIVELDLDRLVARVGGGSEADALVSLDRALTLAEVMNARSDQLVTHFVSQAREAGHSWTEIGRRLGVSKQAARERFPDRSGSLPVAGELIPTVRLRSCLTAAAAEAAGGSVRTDHQLIGLFEDGVAASILDRCGLNSNAVRTAATELDEQSATGSRLADEHAARRTVERAAHLAGQAGHDYLGTEHVLAALILDPGSRAHRVLDHLDVDIGAAKKELDCIMRPKRASRRRGRKQRTMMCSFCGKQRLDGVRLVAGPGACICEHCVRLAQDIVTDTTA